LNTNAGGVEANILEPNLANCVLVNVCTSNANQRIGKLQYANIVIMDLNGELRIEIGEVEKNECIVQMSVIGVPCLGVER
jgi:hypothetical protein